MGSWKRIAVIGLAAALLGGCIMEAEPNNNWAQANRNNRHRLRPGQQLDLAGTLPQGDAGDRWRLNVDEGKLDVSILVSGGNRVSVSLQQCSNTDFPDPYGWPVCARWTDVWVGEVTGAVKLPTLDSTPNYVTGCFLYEWAGCNSPFVHDPYDLWRVRVDSVNGGAYGMRAALT